MRTIIENNLIRGENVYYALQTRTIMHDIQLQGICTYAFDVLVRSMRLAHHPSLLRKSFSS